MIKNIKPLLASKIEKMQNNEALTITGDIGGTSKRKTLPRIRFGVPLAETVV